MCFIRCCSHVYFSSCALNRFFCCSCIAGSRFFGINLSVVFGMDQVPDVLYQSQAPTDAISEDEVTQWCYTYGMPHDQPGPRQKAKEYLHYVMHNSYFTEAVMFNFIHEGRVVCVLAMSCPESTQLQATNDADLNSGIRVAQCYWAKFRVWFFQGLMLGNFAGILDPRHNGRLIPETLGEFLVNMAASTAGHSQMLLEFYFYCSFFFSEHGICQWSSSLLFLIVFLLHMSLWYQCLNSLFNSHCLLI